MSIKKLILIIFNHAKEIIIQININKIVLSITLS